MTMYIFYRHSYQYSYQYSYHRHQDTTSAELDFLALVRTIANLDSAEDGTESDAIKSRSMWVVEAGCYNQWRNTSTFTMSWGER